MRKRWFILRLVNDIGDILFYLSDINTLNTAMLKENAFKDLKDAINQAIAADTDKK